MSNVVPTDAASTALGAAPANEVNVPVTPSVEVDIDRAEGSSGGGGGVALALATTSAVGGTAVAVSSFGVIGAPPGVDAVSGASEGGDDEADTDAVAEMLFSQKLVRNKIMAVSVLTQGFASLLPRIIIFYYRA